MSSEGTLAVAAAVVAVTQIFKWARLPDSWGPLAVILLSIVGVMIWLVSGDSWPPQRTDIWPIFSGIIAVTLSAAGTFGFTRAAASAVTRATAPPDDGAGSSATTDTPPTIDYDRLAEAMDTARRERIRPLLDEQARARERERA